MSSIASDNQSIRWQWLDSAKGIAIFAVMMQHGAHFVLASDDIFASLVIDTFFMPLFFLCSGFVSVKLLNRSVEHKWGIVLKDFSLLLPFVLCGIAYGYCITGGLTISGILMRLLSTWSIGYWFLFVLFLFRIAVIFSDILLSTCNIGRYKMGGGDCTLACSCSYIRSINGQMGIYCGLLPLFSFRYCHAQI
ncbi:acyltransferase family protein [Bacteroides acidifaciens]|uniref:acyltransferase family protein n=1 Tax=Bacteroides acidifaciens TaxID=85831 RepID=UPI003AFB5370